MNKFDRYYMGNRDKCEKCSETTAVYDRNGFLVFCDNCELVKAQDYRMMVEAHDGSSDSVDWGDLDSDIAKEK